MAALLRIRSRVNAEIEPLRAAGKLGKALDAAVTLDVLADDPLRKIIEKHRDFLAELFIVSQVSIETAQVRPGAAERADPVGIHVRHSQELSYVRCPRCWRWVPQLETSAHGDICPRCVEAL
jgi:isoleucyl-tRNA synthetase